MKYLVTGGAELIGSHLILRLLTEGHEMHVIPLLNEIDCNIFHFFIIEVVKTV